ncbi:MAG TPA: type II toxin-antitoxin system VapC family toxin [Candidatus Acidoferrum sp.]|jgi:predicted nucleic acid-binding protein|nr:type II toxin-antitoxin system VapC family toxin [Candidatus Acidoferrum sp.]
MKTYVFDASALFAFLRDKPGASKVSSLLAEAMRGRARILMSAVNYGEVYGLILREYGSEQALTAVHAVRPLPIQLLDATTQRAFQAADIKVKYELYYVDAFAAALAIEHKATLVTSDSDFRKLGHSFPIVWLKV